MVRTLHPDVLRGTQKSKRYQQVFAEHPDYLSDQSRCHLRANDLLSKTGTELTFDEIHMLLPFLRDTIGLDVDVEGDSDPILTEMKFYRRAKVNGLDISTAARDEKKLTCDSVVCGRYLGEDADGEFEEYFIGQVQHIISCRANVLLCVEWFAVDGGEVDDDQLNGLAIIKVSKRRQQEQTWISVDKLKQQQHILVGPQSGETSFHVAIKP